MHYVYILTCADGTLYVGATNNLSKRLKEHNTSARGAHYTKIRRPVTLCHRETFSTLTEARAREAEIKVPRDLPGGIGGASYARAIARQAARY